MLLTVARVRTMRPTIALCCRPSRASASTSCLTPIRVEWGIIRTISENWAKIFNCWFELATGRRQIWGNDHLNFGLRRSHVALKWKLSQGKVGFRWEMLTGTFHVKKFSPLESQQFDPHRFHCLNWGCSNTFSMSVLNFHLRCFHVFNGVLFFT